jgi:signal recognition particle subunit SRP54
MTKTERARPELIDDSRAARIARGSGTRPQEVGDLLKRFEAMRNMMGQLGKGGFGNMLSRIPGVGKQLGGDLPGIDPSALGLPGMAPNRAAARAQRVDAKRQKRKQQRKHKRRGKRR